MWNREMELAKHGRFVVVALPDGKTLMKTRWVKHRWEGCPQRPSAWFDAPHPDAVTPALPPGVVLPVASLPPGVV